MAVDGEWALVGAFQEDPQGLSAGAVEVFRRTGMNWMYVTTLTASDGAGGDFFGASVALDGDTALIGAPGDNDTGANSGSAYVFVHDGET